MGEQREKLREALELIRAENPADMLAFIWRHGHRMKLRNGYGDEHDNNPASYELEGSYAEDARYNYPARTELRDKLIGVALLDERAPAGEREPNGAWWQEYERRVKNFMMRVVDRIELAHAPGVSLEQVQAAAAKIREYRAALDEHVRTAPAAQQEREEAGHGG